MCLLPFFPLSIIHCALFELWLASSFTAPLICFQLLSTVSSPLQPSIMSKSMLDSSISGLIPLLYVSSLRDVMSHIFLIRCLWEIMRDVTEIVNLCQLAQIS